MGVEAPIDGGCPESEAPQAADSGRLSGREAVYFVSDAHFGLDRGERVRVERFGGFAAHVRANAAELYIVGDFFDFWVEYKNAVRPEYFPILYELRCIVDAGVPVRYIVGNHDFAMGSFLEKYVGLTLHRGCVDAELQGRRLHISHGHKVGRKRTQRLVDALLGNKMLQRLYKLLHPNIGVRFGALVSAVSKMGRRKRGVPPMALEKYRRAARARLKSGKSDLVVFAHTHYGEILRFSEGEYCNTGSWMDRYDYAVLRGGKIQLLKWGDSAS
ncbi:MAG: UDP-2,3-diacylglucosamine diphosphatase [Chitinispirillales bacterium]|nr:UDP-2,3-diacylglucosamine diphosphatase [Chitinispirillales bacterium]